MRALMALVYLSSGLLGAFQAAQGKRFLPSYIHRGLSIDRRGFLNLDNAQLKRCTIDDLVQVVSVDDLRRLVEGVALRQATKPVSVLRSILALELATRGSETSPEQRDLEVNLQTIAMRDLFGSVLTLPPASPNLPPPPPVGSFIQTQEGSVSFPPANALPPRMGPPIMVGQGHRVHPGMPSQTDLDKINRLPPFIIGSYPPPPPDTLGLPIQPKEDDSEEMVRGNLPFPSYNFPIPRGFKPPAGATVIVDSGGLTETIQEVPITVSPLMTVVEALRQADFRFQRLLNLEDDSDVFEFARSPFKGCYVISSVGNTSSKSDHLWRVSVQDRNDQIVYESVCLPTGRQVMVKPGMKISLTYGAF